MVLRTLLVAILFWICLLPGGWSVAQEADPNLDTSAELDVLIETLQDDAARSRLIAQLSQLREASQPAGGEVAVDQVVDYLKDKQEAFDDVVLNVVTSWNRIPEFVAWLQTEWSKPARRDLWLDVAIRLTVVFFSGWLVTWLIRRFWPEPVVEPAFWSTFRHFAREAVIIAVYAVTTLAMLFTLDQPILTRRVGLDLVLAMVFVSLWRSMLMSLARQFLRRSLGESFADPLVKSLTKAGSIALGGYFIMSALLRLGLPWSFQTFGLHLVFLAAIGIAVAAITRVRVPVAEKITAMRQSDPTLISRILPLGLLAMSWHLLAIGLILAHYVTWALSLEGGLIFLAQATSTSVVILFAARLLSLYNDRIFERGVPIIPADEDGLVDVQERASRYANPLRLIFRWAIIVAMLLALSWVWRTGLVEWLGSDTGRVVTATLVRLAMLATIAIVLTEGISILVNRFVQDSGGATGRPGLSNRAKTLASLFKNVSIALVIAISVMLGLSEIGVDAAALLAGAGVIGLAIGFGSQRLVQDLINGLFILLGDTVRVGDVIEAAGKAGAVESMSMRTISLRSYDGSVHTLPYSSIDTVTNMTKDYSFAVFDVGISYGSDLELAIRELQSIDQGMRREWPYRRQILAPIDIAGVDALADSAVMIKARIKVKAGDQWSIRREFTKRMKQRFDKVGIEIPFPHRTLMITHEQKSVTNPLPETEPSTTIVASN